MWFCVRYWLSSLFTVDTDEPNSGELSGMATIAPPYQGKEEFTSSIKQDVENLYYFVLDTVCKAHLLKG
jgi:hypothetical protein